LESFATRVQRQLSCFWTGLNQRFIIWHYSEATLLQYVDDLILYGTRKPLISRANESLLNFLASRGYKVSKEKVQLCLPKVTYIGMILKGQICSLSYERINPILCFPLPQTIKQFRAFLGVTGFCKIWIPRYAALARPLFMLLLIFLFGP
jgi:hypothetical protein